MRVWWEKLEKRFEPGSSVPTLPNPIAWPIPSGNSEQRPLCSARRETDLDWRQSEAGMKWETPSSPQPSHQTFRCARLDLSGRRRAPVERSCCMADIQPPTFWLIILQLMAVILLLGSDLMFYIKALKSLLSSGRVFMKSVSRLG